MNGYVETSLLAKQMSCKPDLRLVSDLIASQPATLPARKPRIRKELYRHQPPISHESPDDATGTEHAYHPAAASPGPPSAVAPDAPGQHQSAVEACIPQQYQAPVQPDAPRQDQIPVPPATAPPPPASHLAPASYVQPPRTVEKTQFSRPSPPPQPHPAVKQASIPAAAQPEPAAQQTPAPPAAQPIVIPSAGLGGYQRLRLPAGTRQVINGAILLASCVDGGSPEHRNRLPPPPAHPMPYTSSNIRVRRIAPNPSPILTLDEAQRRGVFSLLGTGCADHVQVACPPDELWQISVDGPLSLISPQDDLPGAVALYNKPAILQQLEYLDRVENQLRQFTPSRCLLLWLYSCLRREVSWLLPTAADTAGLTRIKLARFCHMLFEDPQSRYVFNWFAAALQPADELAPLGTLKDAMAKLPYRPSEQALRSLSRALAKSQPLEPYVLDCVDSIAREADARLPQEYLSLMRRLLTDIAANIKTVLAQRQFNQEQTAGILATLYSSTGQAVAPNASFCSILAHSVTLNNDMITTFPPAEFLWTYITHYLRGEQSQTNEMYEILRANADR